MLRFITAKAQDPLFSIPFALQFVDTDLTKGEIGGVLYINESRNPFYPRYINSLSPGLSLDSRLFDYFSVYLTNTSTCFGSDAVLFALFKFEPPSYGSPIAIRVPDNLAWAKYLGVAVVEQQSISGAVISSNCTLIPVIDAFSECSMVRLVID